MNTKFSFHPQRVTATNLSHRSTHQERVTISYFGRSVTDISPSAALAPAARDRPATQTSHSSRLVFFSPRPRTTFDSLRLFTTHCAFVHPSLCFCSRASLQQENYTPSVARANEISTQIAIPPDSFDSSSHTKHHCAFADSSLSFCSLRQQASNPPSAAHANDLLSLELRFLPYFDPVRRVVYAYFRLLHYLRRVGYAYFRLFEHEFP